MPNQTLNFFIIGTASAVIAGIAVAKFTNSPNTGGGRPRQANLQVPTSRGGRINPQVPERTSRNAAPLVQNTPITEAAYNLQPTQYDTTLGPEQNQSEYPLTLPM